jgi:small subunit ribosomal protein S13
MARLVGVDLPREKRVEIALTYIYGIGRTTSKQLLAATGVSPDTRVHALAEEELVALAKEIEGRVKK